MPVDESITPDEFEQFRRLIYDESGISLGDQKRSLLASRLSKRLRELDLATFSEYYERVTEDPTREEFTKMLDLISTNKTDFFREPKHFDFLRERILPELDQTKRIRIWSSACSTGEEPYTIAMTLYESVQNPAQWDCKILASDLSTRVLAKAASGTYNEERVRDVPLDVVRRYFLRGRGDSAGLLKVKPHLADTIRFRRLNLMDESYPIKTPLDLIFCRNVMIYFDRPTQEKLVNRFYRYLKPGGYLFHWPFRKSAVGQAPVQIPGANDLSERDITVSRCTFQVSCSALPSSATMGCWTSTGRFRTDTME